MYILENMKVKNVIIGKQFESSNNYTEFLKIIEKNKIKVYEVEAGQKINIDKYTYFDVLWPSTQDCIQENKLNNNSLVCKLVSRGISVLFTGDIEEAAEKQILKKYENNLKILKTDILKVAHHGSKTSTTLEFLNAVKPKYAIIGVGKENKFGHPSNITIQNLKKMNVKVYRTDEMGEIMIKINNKRKILIEKMIN
mgnify:FL=1